MRREIVGLLVVVLLVLSSITLIKPLISTPTPLMPQFYVRIAAYPTDEPASYKIDHVYLQTVTSSDSYGNKTLQVLIKNQPLPLSLTGKTYHLYYNVRIKENTALNWTEQYHYSLYSSGNCPIQSNEEYTILSFPPSYPDSTTLDFQVMALIGTEDLVAVGGQLQTCTVMNITSGWSYTETIVVDLDSALMLQPQSL